MPIKGYERRVTVPVLNQKYTDVGNNDFYLIAYRDPCAFLRRDFFIETEEGYILEEDVDFEFTSLDHFYSGGLYEDEEVASTIRVKNPEYQTGSLYISYRWVADYASAEMLNRFDRGLDQMINSIVTDNSSSVVVDNSGNVVVQGENYPGYREEL